MRRLILTILAVGIIMLSACVAPVFLSESTPSLTTTQTTKTHIYTDGKIEVKGSGEPVELINNPNATNPTFAELVAFIKRDRTDTYSYIFGPPKNAFVCSDFAETVHNNAEAAGIRAAWVGIDIEGETKGHALNAFETTDLGLVYIDCTGKGLWDDPTKRSSWDRRVRVEIGKPYAVADIDKAKTLFKFLVHPAIGADDMVSWTLGEQTLRSLELSGWIRIPTVGEREKKYLEMLEWLRTHDIEELGQKWIQDWIREHQAELSRCSREFKLENYSILVDCLETPWFQPVEKLIDVDGMPIVWKIRWEM